MATKAGQIASLNKALVREENKLLRQQEAVVATEALIEVIKNQIAALNK